MADRLTQLQEALDELCTMFIAAFYYVERHHDLKPFGPGDKIPDLKADQPKEVETLDPETFKAGQLELARDLITKEQQIEYLVSTLPGLDNSEREQMRMIQDLEEEIAAAEAQRLEAVKERDELLGKLDMLLRTIERP
ncbi:hypothetical protein VTK56DRAFT_6388 [Thermocarpiscus australiensis]